VKAGLKKEAKAHSSTVRLIVRGAWTAFN